MKYFKQKQYQVVEEALLFAGSLNFKKGDDEQIPME